MNTELHDRLVDLADQAPIHLPPDGLWERGRRYRRRRRTGTAVIAAVAVLVLGVLSAFVVQRSAEPPRPEPASGPVGLPDQIYEPSPWLPGTDDKGPLGTIVALVGADRKSWSGSTPGVVGISATSGEYRFLDLPDAAVGWEGSSLSPDGRRVAYWLAGEPSGSPRPIDEGGRAVVGVAVYDAVTGEVRRGPIPTEHGLDTGPLLWSDADTLLFAPYQWQGGESDPEVEQGFANVEDQWVWRLGDPVSRPLPQEFRGAPLFAGGGRAAFRLGGLNLEFELTTADAGEVVGNYRLRTRTANEVLVPDATGSRVASVWAGSVPNVNRLPNKLIAGPLPAPRSSERPQDFELPRVPHSQLTFAVLGWTDASHVALIRPEGIESSASDVVEQDIASGAIRQLVRLPDDNWGGGIRFATDLLSAPTVHAPPPPEPMDPRAIAGIAVGVVFSALLALLVWRRRVRP